MNKRIFLLAMAVLACFLPCFLTAQEIKVTKSPNVMKGMSAGFAYRLAGQAGENIYAYRTFDESILLHKFDKVNLQLTATKELDFKLNDDGKRVPSFNKILVLKNNIIIFTNRYFKDEDQNHLFARTYNLDFEPETDWQKIETINAERSRNSGTFLISTSTDSSKILIAKIEPYEKKGYEKLSFSMFDAGMNKLADKKEELEYKDKRATIKEHKIAADGTVYFALRVSGEEDFEFKIYKFDLSKENELNESDFELELPEKKIIDIAFETNHAGDFLIAGFYATEKYKINGIFSAWIMRDDESAVVEAVTSEFKKISLTNKYEIDKLNILPDNSFEIIAEERYENTTTSSSSGYTTTYYYENKIIYIQVLEEGGVSGYYSIPKYAASDVYYNTYHSYFVLFGSERILFCNEHRKSFESAVDVHSVPGTPKSKKRVLAYTTFAANGKINKTILLREKDEKFGLAPRHGLQISPSEVVMFGRNKTQYVLYKFSVVK